MSGRGGRSALAGALVAVATAAATSALAGAFARAVVTPVTRRRDDVRVLEVTDDAVVLEATPDTLARGLYGLWLPGGGHARLGEVRASGDGAGGRGRLATVTRELLGVDSGGLVPGAARWSAAYFAGDPAAALGLAFTDVTVASDAGPMPAWFVPGAARSSASPDDDRTWAVLVHGRGASREECLRALPLLHRIGVDALVMSYRNDGDAAPSASGRYGLGETEWADVEAAIVHALASGARHVVLVGWSMGGAIALQLLARSWTASAVRAVVLDAPVIDWRDVLDHHAALNRLPRGVGRYGLGLLGSPLARAVTGVEQPVDLEALDWVERAGELAVPVLLMHGGDDDHVPIGPSRALAAARPDLVTFAEFAGAGHVREWNTDPERWEREVARFLLGHL